MPDPIELDSIDALGAGAVGEPGQRAFYIQARSESAQLTVLVEKEQVALLATEAVAFLDRIADQYPEDMIALPEAVAELREPTVPLFRARMIGLGFDPERELVLIELREHSEDEDDDEDEAEADEPAAEQLGELRAAQFQRGHRCPAGSRGCEQSSQSGRPAATTPAPCAAIARTWGRVA